VTSTGIFLIAIGAIAVVALTFILYHQNHGVSVGAILREDDIDRWTLVLNLRNRDRSDVTVDAVTVTVNGYYSGMTSRDYVTSPRFDGVDFPHRLPGSSSEMWTAPDTGIMSTAYALMDPSIFARVEAGARTYYSIVELAWYGGSKSNSSS
jgi:predicted deacylase